MQTATDYSAEDADITLRLHQRFTRRWRLMQLDFIYSQIEMPSRGAVQDPERHGVLIGKKLQQQKATNWGRKCWIWSRRRICSGQPFNLSSPKQIGEILFDEAAAAGGEKTPKGAPSTDEDVLEKLAENYPLPKALLEYRSLARKLKSTYTDKLPLMVNPATGGHTNYAQAVAITGRLASSDPNLQNIPVRTAGRRIREAFIAAPGLKLISADYSQIELRIMAHISGDETCSGLQRRRGYHH